MAKDKIAYVCSNCGQESQKWIGKCPSCGQWNTFKEIRIANDTGTQAARSAAASLRSGVQSHTQGSHALRLKDISNHDDPRIDMHDEELNRVLGGGLVPGSIILLGGEPGIGKSTLSLQTMLSMPDKRILYVSGEDGVKQNGTKGREYFEAACAGNNGNGCSNLGVMYEKGDTVGKDLNKAMELYSYSCILQDSKGCISMARLYIREDSGIKTDYVKGKTYMELACKYGDDNACEDLKSFR